LRRSAQGQGQGAAVAGEELQFGRGRRPRGIDQNEVGPIPVSIGHLRKVEGRGSFVHENGNGGEDVLGHVVEADSHSRYILIAGDLKTPLEACRRGVRESLKRKLRDMLSCGKRELPRFTRDSAAVAQCPSERWQG